MKQLLIVLLLLGYFGSGVQAAEDDQRGYEDGERGYVGVFYGQVDTSDGGVENGNLGLVIGGSLDSGPGVEFFYSDTVDKDEFQSDTFPDIRYSTQVWGLLGTYRFGTKQYGLLKAGYTFIDVKGEVAGGTNEKFDEDGLSYGVGFGIEVGNSGAVELNYLVLPDIELSVGTDNLDTENEMYTLGYYWHF